MKGLLIGGVLLCTTMMAFAQHSLQRFEAPINTDTYDEICPIMSYEEDYMFFTRVGSPTFDKTLFYDSTDLYLELDSVDYISRLADIYKILSGRYPTPYYQSTFNQDVWFTLSDKGRLANIHHPGYPINSALPNSICSTFGSEDKYIIVNQFFVDGSLRPGFSYVTFDGKSNFTFPEPIDIRGYENQGSDVNLTMSNDGQLIFLSMRGRDSQGDMDLYISRKLTDSLYSIPENLSSLNTPYRESTPFISKDRTKLYFASNRPGGYGKTDIYVSERLDYSYKSWSKPRLLKEPLNSPFDESHPYVGLDENTMLFTSNRDGSMDIFRAKVNRDSVLAHDIEMRIRILDADGIPVAGEINWSQAYDYEPPFTGFFRPRDGHYTYTIRQNIPHTFYATKRTVMSQKAIVDPQELMDAGIHEYYLDLYLGMDGKEIKTSIARDVVVFNDVELEEEPLEIDTLVEEVAVEEDISKLDEEDLSARLMSLDHKSSVLLDNIYFSRGRSEVLPASFPTLRRLAKVLIDNPHAIIQIEGHTDNVGDRRALRQLSEDRSRAIKNFLVKEGVLSQAIKTKGFGAENPLNANETERDRKANRRVEIRVLQGGPKSK